MITRVIDCVNAQSCDYEFVLIGGGELFGELEAGVKKFDNVTLTNQIAHEQVLAHLKKADICLVYLNDRFPEAYIDAGRSSTKLFEYLAHGKVVVASDFGEPANLLAHNESGILVKNDPHCFAHAILALEQDDIKRIEANGGRLFEEMLSHPVLMQKCSCWLSRL